MLVPYAATSSSPRELLKPWSGVFVLAVTVPQLVHEKPSMVTFSAVSDGSAEPSVIVWGEDADENENTMSSLSFTALIASRRVQSASQVPSLVSAVEFTVQVAPSADAGTSNEASETRARVRRPSRGVAGGRGTRSTPLGPQGRLATIIFRGVCNLADLGAARPA